MHTDLNNRLAQSRTGSLTLLEFVFFLKENPACIAPIDTLQSDLKKNILSKHLYYVCTDRLFCVLTFRMKKGSVFLLPDFAQ